MRLTHPQLEMFQTLLRTLSVTETAQELASSQPTISRELKALEAQLGFALFDRKSRRLEPTSRALALNVVVQRSFLSIAEIERAAQAIRGERLHRLTIACLPAFAHALIPDVVRALRQNRPDTTFKVHSLEEGALTRDILAKFFDLALVEGNISGTAGVTTTMRCGDLVCIMPPDHALAQQVRLKPTDFGEHDVIYYSDEDTYRRRVDLWFQSAGVTPRLAIETTTATSMAAMVGAGLGVAIVNPLTALASDGAQVAVRPMAQPIAYAVNLWRPDATGRNRLGDEIAEVTTEAIRAIARRLAERGLTNRAP